MLQTLSGIVIGGVAGYLLHRIVGCPTGGCPLTSNPYISVIYGAIMGILFTSGK